MQSRARPSTPQIAHAGQHAVLRRHPIHGMAGHSSTSPRKTKVRAIDSKRPRAKRFGLKDLLAEIPARRARMITVIALVIFIAWFLVFIFQPAPSYELTDGKSVPFGTANYMRMLEALGDAHFDRQSSVEVFTNGENFYPAELELIRNAKKSVDFEAYIFQ